MKTIAHKIMQLFLLLGMLLPVAPSLAAADAGDFSKEIQDTVVASTPRIAVMGNVELYLATEDNKISNILVTKLVDIPISTGTGILIHKSEREAYVLTNAHVILQRGDILKNNDGKPLVLKTDKGPVPVFGIVTHAYYAAIFPKGENDPLVYPVQEVVCRNLQDEVENSIDAAVLRISPKGLPETLKIAASELAVSQPVVALGYPGKHDRPTSLEEWGTDNPLIIALKLALKGKMGDFKQIDGYISVSLSVKDRDYVNTSVTMGNISRYDRTKGMPQRIIHTADIGPGNSGGPLIEPRSGYVVGINTWGLAAGNTSSVAQSAATIIGFLKSNNIPYEEVVLPSEQQGGPVNWVVYAIVGGLALLIILVLAVSKLLKPNKPCITLFADGQSYMLSASKLKKGVLLGRSSQADVYLPHPTVSARHARLLMRNERLFIEDIGSKGGTKLNGKPLQVHSPAPLTPGSTITLANIDVKVH